MATGEVLPFERLLHPISDENPSGLALRSDGTLAATYYEIRDASQQARDLERQVREYAFLSEEDKTHEPSPESPNWSKVVKLATDTLADVSKDLWIAAWLTESLVRTDGFAGLRDGFRLIRQLSEDFWDTIHPRPDEDDGILHTVSQLSSLNSTLITPIQEIAIVPETRSFPSLTSVDYIDAVELDKMDPEQRSQRIAGGSATLDMFDRAINEAPTEALNDLLEDIQAARKEFTQLCEVLDDKCGQDEDGYSLAPPSSDISDILESCFDRVRDLTRHCLAGDTQGDADPTETKEDSPVSARLPNSTEVQNRDDAFQLLLKVSSFFRRTEPHSPVSYALEQAVRWGRMSLPRFDDGPDQRRISTTRNVQTGWYSRSVR
ncbi:MAG: type VI secretion system protein TssA [Pirellulaceae bacterium]